MFTEGIIQSSNASPIENKGAYKIHPAGNVDQP
jgi:hypothetical protein